MRRRRRNEAVTRRFPLYAIRVASVLGFSAVGFLLARVLRGRPVLTAVTLGLVLASGALARLEEGMNERDVSRRPKAPSRIAVLESLSPSQLRELADRYEVTLPPDARAERIAFLAGELPVSDWQVEAIVQSIIQRRGRNRAGKYYPNEPPHEDEGARVVQARRLFKKGYRLESDTFGFTSKIWSESENEDLVAAQQQAPVKIGYDSKSRRKWWMYRGRFYWAYRRYAPPDSAGAEARHEADLEQKIRRVAWRDEVRTGKLPTLVDDPRVLRRHPREREKASSQLDWQQAEKSAVLNEEQEQQVTRSEQPWQDEFDRYLIESIQQHGVFWAKPFWPRIKGMVQRAMRDYPLHGDDFGPENRWLGEERDERRERITQSMMWLQNRYTCWRLAQRRAGQLPAAMRAYRRKLSEQRQYHQCLICGWTFRPCDLPDYLYLEGEDGTDFCHTCLMEMVYPCQEEGHRVHRPASKSLMRDAVSTLVGMMGFVPSQDFRSVDTLRRVQRARRPEVVMHLWKMRTAEEYKSQFGSWLKALIAAEVLTDDCYPTGIGTRCVARDGHECLSLEERQIDDWLYEAGIPHAIEPPYPWHRELNPHGLRRADWEVNGVFIEYWGLVGDREYDRRMRAKRRLAEGSDIALIEIYPDDLYHLEQKLGSMRAMSDSKGGAREQGTNRV
jgi:hypothetical protein